MKHKNFCLEKNEGGDCFESVLPTFSILKKMAFFGSFFQNV